MRPRICSTRVNRRWDVVTAGDVCYERPMADAGDGLAAPAGRRQHASSCSAIRDAPILPPRAWSNARATSCRPAASSRTANTRETVVWEVLPSVSAFSQDSLGNQSPRTCFLRVFSAFEPRPNSFNRLAVLREIIGRQPCRSVDLLLDHCVGLRAADWDYPLEDPRFPSALRRSSTASLRAVPLQERPRASDRCRRTRVICERNSRRSDLPKLSISSARFSQSSGRFEPCWPEAGFGLPQRCRLLLRPAHEVFVVERL